MFVGHSEDVLECFSIEGLEEQSHHEGVDQPGPAPVKEPIPPAFEGRDKGIH